MACPRGEHILHAAINFKQQNSTVKYGLVHLLQPSAKKRPEPKQDTYGLMKINRLRFDRIIIKTKLLHFQRPDCTAVAYDCQWKADFVKCC